MTSLFFFPNVFMPLVAGALSHTYGAAKCAARPRNG
jgi:hypothetical protein